MCNFGGHSVRVFTAETQLAPARGTGTHRLGFSPNTQIQNVLDQLTEKGVLKKNEKTEEANKQVTN